MRLTFGLVAAPVLIGSALAQSFVHPGMLHTSAQIAAVAEPVVAGESPWIEGWNNLVKSPYCRSTTYQPTPGAALCRGALDNCTQKFANIYRDCAAAFQGAVRWKLSNDTAYADVAVRIINGWSGVLTSFAGNSSQIYLAAGIYGYQFANAVELVRDYSGFSATNLTSAINLLTNVFYPISHSFLTYHSGTKIDHYYANWDLAKMATVMATGILCGGVPVFQGSAEL